MRQITALTTLVESTQPFKVRTGCGHIVIRKMREATAGVPYTEETIIDAPNGRPCEDCDPDARIARALAKAVRHFSLEVK